MNEDDIKRLLQQAATVLQGEIERLPEGDLPPARKPLERVRTIINIVLESIPVDRSQSHES